MLSGSQDLVATKMCRSDSLPQWQNLEPTIGLEPMTCRLRIVCIVLHMSWFRTNTHNVCGICHVRRRSVIFASSAPCTGRLLVSHIKSLCLHTNRAQGAQYLACEAGLAANVVRWFRLFILQRYGFDVA